MSRNARSHRYHRGIASLRFELPSMLDLIGCMEFGDLKLIEVLVIGHGKLYLKVTGSHLFCGWSCRL